MQDIFHLLPMAVSGVLSAECILSLLSRRTRPHFMLLLWLVSCFLLYTCHYVYFSIPDEPTPVWNVTYTTVNLLVYPLFLIYISEQTDRYPLSRQPWILFGITIPAWLALVVSILLYSSMDKNEIEQFTQISLYHHPGTLYGSGAILHIVHYICKTVFAIEVIIVTLFCIKKIKGYNMMLSTLYADTEEKSMQKFNILLMLMLITSFLSFGVNILGRHIFLSKSIIAVPSLIFSCLILGLGWNGLKQHFSIADVRTSREEATKREEEGDTPSPIGIEEKKEDATDSDMSKEEALSRQFTTIMAQERLYLHHDLKLDDVVMKMGTNRTYLLQAIKSEFNMSFSEYVNRLRIKHAQQLEKEQPTLSREEISTRSGYNTVSSFYRNLKKYGSST